MKRHYLLLCSIVTVSIYVLTGSNASADGLPQLKEVVTSQAQQINVLQNTVAANSTLIQNLSNTTNLLVVNTTALQNAQQQIQQSVVNQDVQIATLNASLSSSNVLLQNLNRAVSLATTNIAALQSGQQQLITSSGAQGQQILNTGNALTVAQGQIQTLNVTVSSLMNTVGSLSLSQQQVSDAALLRLTVAAQSANLNLLSSEYDALSSKVGALANTLNNISGSVASQSAQLTSLTDNVNKIRSSAGPAAYDVSGKLLGALVSTNEVTAIRRFDIFDSASNAIYPVNPINGKFADYGDQTVWFTSTDCTGQPYAYDNNTNYAISGATSKRFFIFDNYNPVNLLARSELNGGCSQINNGNGNNLYGYYSVSEVHPSFIFPLSAPLHLGAIQ